MKGLEEYIKVHGRHFTEKLALEVTDGRWDAVKVYRASQRKVYYNVTGSTLGDMVYLTNEAWDNWNYKTIHEAINYVLFIVGDYKYYGGVLFSEWLEELNDFDFTPYI